MTETTGLTEADHETIRREFLKAWRHQAEEVGPEAVDIYEKLVATIKGN